MAGQPTVQSLMAQAQQSKSYEPDLQIVDYLDQHQMREMLDYLPAAKIPDATKSEYLREWERIVRSVGWERFDIAIDQVKRSVVDDEGNIHPRKAYQFPTPAEVRQAVPPMYVQREFGRYNSDCVKCQGSRWVTRMFEEEVPGYGLRNVPRATRCTCWEEYRQSRLNVAGER